MKAINTQLTGLLKTDLNNDWKAFKSSLSQVALFCVNEGKADLSAWIEQRGGKLKFNDTKSVIDFYKKHGAFTRKFKGANVPKTSFSVVDVCNAVNTFLKSVK